MSHAGVVLGYLDTPSGVSGDMLLGCLVDAGWSVADLEETIGALDWPAGTPRKLDGNGKLGPAHGGYHDIDACPALTFLIENRDKKSIAPFFHLSIDKRPGEELFDITTDPANLRNLAADEKHADTLRDCIERVTIASRATRRDRS